MTAAQDELGQLCIQVHPARAPGLDLPRLRATCEALARRAPGVRGIGFAEGEDEGPYLNIVFASEDPPASWRSLGPALLESAEFGASLKAACMAMCTGEQGWDDHLVLHHFDPEVPLDDVDGDVDVDDGQAPGSAA